MPELPEVETVRAGLQRLLPGREVGHVEVPGTANSFPNPPEDVRRFLAGAHVAGVRRRAKVLLIDLSTGYTLVIHLKMTGQLVFIQKQEARNQKHEILNNVQNQNDQNAEGLEFRNSNFGFAKPDEVRFGAGHPSVSLIGELPDRSTRVVLSFADGSRLYFNDQRRFGWMRLMPTAEVPNMDFMRKVGPEPLEADFTWQVLLAQLKRRANTSVKAAILDQTVVAGIGNIYADESLWGAKVHPKTLVKHLTDPDIKHLHTALVDVLRLSIAKGGSTDHTYVDAEGRKGSYLTFANVFRREGQPCPRHPDTTIEKLRVAGRGTHICPKCQRIK